MCRFYVRIQPKEPIHMNKHDGIGVDVGIKEFATCSHHETFKNINKTIKAKKLEKSLKRQQRKLKP